MMDLTQTYSMPNEVLDQIVSYLPIQERMSTFPAVCKHWYHLALDHLRYDSREIASKTLKTYGSSLSETELIGLSERKYLIEFENTLLKRLGFCFAYYPLPEKSQIEFSTPYPQKFQVFKYNRILESNNFNVRYDPHIKDLKISKKPKRGCLRVPCYMQANTFTTTAEMAHRDDPEDFILDEKFVIKEIVYFEHCCAREIEKATKFRKWKTVKSAVPYREAIKNINSVICFHVVSLIETVSRYNFQSLKEYNSIEAFKIKKIFDCNYWGEISIGNPISSFEIYEKEIQWHDGKKITTLRWNDPACAARGTKGDNFIINLRHAVFSRTTELLLAKLGLLNFS